ncbi:MAG: RsmE family RNA methyltransferase, partial [Vicinamibacterales bacterium]
MSLPRFYLPTLSHHSEEAQLPVEEAQHLTRVLRLQPGNNVRIFDGRGHEREATIKHVTGKKVTVSLGKPVCAAKESTIKINIGIALLAGRKFDAVIRDATMLGASVITPLITLRSRGFKIRKDSNRLAERWHDIAVASTKQCGRSHLPVVSPPFQFSQYVETQSIRAEQKLLLVEPSRHTPGHR